MVANTVDVWLLNLDISERQSHYFWNRLSADEQQRADKFKFPELRDRFVAARGFLRLLLSDCCGIAMRDLFFVYNEYGKPSLDKPDVSLDFNLSHCRQWACYAITQNSIQLGVDIEFNKPMSDLPAMLDMVFNLEELSLFKVLDPDEQRHYFYQQWVCKEAILKALGQGLSYPLKQCALEKIKDGMFCALTKESPDNTVQKWFVSLLSEQFLPESMSGAIALPNDAFQLIYKTTDDLPESM
ncbi:MAG: 4'-phosphopantetheinyl transferase family protein [Arenicella sp.]